MFYDYNEKRKIVCDKKKSLTIEGFFLFYILYMPYLGNPNFYAPF